MPRMFRLFLPWLVLGLTGAGCESVAPVQPRETQTVALDPGARQAAVAVAVGNALRLTLPAPRQPGHQWQIVQNDTRYLQPLDPLQPATGAEPAVAAFRAMRLGRTQLKFLAAPTNSPAGGNTAEYYDVTVTID